MGVGTEGLGAMARPARHMDDRLDDRVDAVERAISDGHTADGLPETARMEQRLDDIEATVEDLDDRLADLEAAVQALRGFAGGIRAVDEEVERRANAAVARVERLEADLQEATGHGDDRSRRDESDPSHAVGTAVDDGPEREDDREWRDDTDDGGPGHATEGVSGGVGSGTDGVQGRSDTAATIGDAGSTGSAGWTATERSKPSKRSDSTLAEAAATAATAVDRPDTEGSETGDESEDGTASLADRVRRLL